MSTSIWANGIHKRPAARTPLKLRDGVVLGPAGEAVVAEFLGSLANALDPAHATKDAARLVQLLFAGGVDPFNVSDATKYANVIHALQWPRIFKRWSELQAADPTARLPVKPLDLIDRILDFEKRSFGDARFPDALAAWRWFRSEGQP
jgi:hypothetical protein